MPGKGKIGSTRSSTPICSFNWRNLIVGPGFRVGWLEACWPISSGRGGFGFGPVPEHVVSEETKDQRSGPNLEIVRKRTWKVVRGSAVFPA